jgi:hypothetical protein
VFDGSCEYAEDYYDCDGNCTTGEDCFGICGGTAILDCAGECGGIMVQDCAGECNGGSVVDECGVCGGSGASFECGCEDIPDGYCDCDENQMDECGECGGDGTACNVAGCTDDGNLDPSEWENLGYGSAEDYPYRPACNYNMYANEDDGSCLYPLPDYDCDGNCIHLAGEDCLGECGGTAILDWNGECHFCEEGYNEVGEECETSGYLDDCEVWQELHACTVVYCECGWM